MKNLFSFLLLMATFSLAANNLQIKNVALVNNDPVAKTVMIQFDLSWDNSWHDDINWDAAWVFAKYFTGEKPYHHCKLDLNGALTGTGTTHQLIVPNDSLELDGTYYGVGAFIYRDVLGDGTFDANGVQLKWHYGLNGIDELPEDIEVQVYGTEMVYIPEGPFAFGDGDGESMSNYSWHLKDTPDYVYIGDYLTPLMIHYYGDDQAQIIGLRVHGKNGLDWDGDGVIDNPNYPTGYNAYYMMKYEVTQGQYADFLNTLTDYQISYSNLFPNQLERRFTILFENEKYVCNRPDRACNYFEYQMPLSYADWAALRPMTALEFEKAARGPLNPVVEEYAWGTDNYVYTQAISGPENGTETALPEDANYRRRYGNLNGGDGGEGPVRAGIFANENSDRVLSGASYYGVMELTGNLVECMVELIRNDSRYYRGFQYFPGDGEIDSNGYANSFFNRRPDQSFYSFSSLLPFGRTWNISRFYDLGEVNIGVRFTRNAPLAP